MSTTTSPPPRTPHSVPPSVYKRYLELLTLRSTLPPKQFRSTGNSSELYHLERSINAHVSACLSTRFTSHKLSDEVTPHKTQHASSLRAKDCGNRQSANTPDPLASKECEKNTSLPLCANSLLRSYEDVIGPNHYVPDYYGSDGTDTSDSEVSSPRNRWRKNRRSSPSLSPSPPPSSLHPSHLSHPSLSPTSPPDKQRISSPTSPPSPLQISQRNSISPSTSPQASCEDLENNSDSCSDSGSGSESDSLSRSSMSSSSSSSSFNPRTSRNSSSSSYSSSSSSLNPSTSLRSSSSSNTSHRSRLSSRHPRVTRTLVPGLTSETPEQRRQRIAEERRRRRREAERRIIALSTGVYDVGDDDKDKDKDKDNNVGDKDSVDKVNSSGILQQQHNTSSPPPEKRVSVTSEAASTSGSSPRKASLSHRPPPQKESAFRQARRSSLVMNRASTSASGRREYKENLLSRIGSCAHCGTSTSFCKGCRRYVERYFEKEKECFKGTGYNPFSDTGGEKVFREIIRRVDEMTNRSRDGDVAFEMSSPTSKNASSSSSPRGFGDVAHDGNDPSSLNQGQTTTIIGGNETTRQRQIREGIDDVLRYLHKRDEHSRRWMNERERSFHQGEEEFKRKLTMQVFGDVDVSDLEGGQEIKDKILRSCKRWNEKSDNIFDDDGRMDNGEEEDERDPLFEKTRISRWLNGEDRKLYIPENLQHIYSGKATENETKKRNNKGKGKIPGWEEMTFQLKHY